MDVKQTAAFFRDRAAPNKWFQALGVAILVFVIYLVTSKGVTNYDHFVRLADAFLDGKLYLENPPSWLELIRIEDRGYVINPPAPTLFVLPAVAIWGLSTNQVIISMMVAAAAIGLFWVAAAPTSGGWPPRAACGCSLTYRRSSSSWLPSWRLREGIARCSSDCSLVWPDCRVCPLSSHFPSMHTLWALGLAIAGSCSAGWCHSD